MDPFSALGVASSIIQVVDFSTRLTLEIVEIGRSPSGLSKKNDALKSKAQKMNDYYETLGQALVPSPPHKHWKEFLPPDIVAQHEKDCHEHVAAVCRVVSHCRDLCLEIKRAIDDLYVSRTDRYWALRAVKTAIFSREAMENLGELHERLKAQEQAIQVPFHQLLDAQQRYLLDIGKYNASQTVKILHTQQSGIDDITAQFTEIKAQYAARTDLGTLGDRVHDLVWDVGLRLKQLAFARTLSYPELNDRVDTISHAQKQTFEWVFGPYGPESLNDDAGPGTADLSFIDWLRTGSGAFWISGKPASGKSTLMKFIISHDKTRQAIEAWSGDKPVALAYHFFWKAGSPRQHSLKALYLSLLLRVLTAAPELGPVLFPDRFRAFTGDPTRLHNPDSELWSTSELQHGLDVLSTRGDLPAKACLFIDGLDEYDGDHHELAKMICAWAAKGNVKTCVASRSWAVFERFFGRLPGKLYVDKLTHLDIYRYATAKLSEAFDDDNNMISREDISKMCDYITLNAAGVFLWVVLVIKLLRDGYTNGDDATDLQGKLRRLPHELQDMFQHVLKSIPPDDHRYMAHVFRTISAVQDVEGKDHYKDPVCSAAPYLFLQEDFEEPEYTMRPATDHTLRLFEPDRTRLESKLHAVTGGLLYFEVSERRTSIRVLHLTVFDYLRTKAMQTYLTGLSHPHFSPWLSVLKSQLQHFRYRLHSGQFMLNGSRIKNYEAVRNIYAARFWILHAAGKALRENAEGATRLIDSVLDLAEEEGIASSADCLENLAWFLEISCRPLLDHDVPPTREEPGWIQTIVASKAPGGHPVYAHTLSLKRLFYNSTSEEDLAYYIDAKTAHDKDFFHGQASVQAVWPDSEEEIGNLLVHHFQPHPTLLLWSLYLRSLSAGTHFYHSILHVLPRTKRRTTESTAALESCNGKCRDVALIELHKDETYFFGQEQHSFEPVLPEIMNAFFHCDEREVVAQVSHALHYTEWTWRLYHYKPGLEQTRYNLHSRLQKSNRETYMTCLLTKAMELRLPAARLETFLGFQFEFFDDIQGDILAQVAEYVAAVKRGDIKERVDEAATQGAWFLSAFWASMFVVLFCLPFMLSTLW